MSDYGKLLERTVFQGMKIAQYEGISVVKDQECPHCHKSDVSATPPQVRAEPVGWCDTLHGFMAVFEFPECFCRFRCHINSGGRYNVDAFYETFALFYYLYRKR